MIEASTRVPFVDLDAVHAPVVERLLDDVRALIESGAFSNGPQVATFEDAFAAYIGVDQCVGVASGLDALRLALLALEPQPGDEVLVPAHTFAATFEAIVQAGAVPVPVDVGETDYGLEVDATASAVGERTIAILPVHLYGQMADMRRLGDIAQRRGLAVIEDACQAHGAVRDGMRAGAAGTAAAFSFYPTKNLGAMGDAGAVTTDHASVAECARMLREHGQASKHEHVRVGYTARLDTIQALVLLQKLPDLDAWNDERRRIAASYVEALNGVGDLRMPPVPAGSEPVWHLFAVRTGALDDLRQFLADRGIATGRHYPQLPHASEAFAHLGHRPGSFPVSVALAAELLSLPVYPGLGADRQREVISAVRAFFAHA